MGTLEVTLGQKVKIASRRATTQKMMFPGDILILAVVLKQKLARRTKRPESAKLSDKTRRAKVGKS